MMRIALVLFFLQTGRVERLSEKQISDTHTIALLSDSTRSQVTIRVVLEEKSGPAGAAAELASFPASHNYALIRADRQSLVLHKSSDYGFTEAYVKLFFDVASRKVLKTTEFKDPSFTQISDADAQRALGSPVEFVWRLKIPFEPKPLPQELLATPLPQSTYADFTRARPARVRDGYGPKSTIREKIEAFQIAADVIWFGKSFYDGEGFTGVGAIGSLDRRSKKYAFLRIPEAVDWSVSSLVVEGDTIWAGLVRHPEGADQPGGLIRHNVKTGVTRRYPVSDVIYRIERSGDALFLTTSNGVYALRGDRLTRHRVEPDINGNVVIVSEQL
jgi:hypothetical protein